MLHVQEHWFSLQGFVADCEFQSDTIGIFWFNFLPSGVTPVHNTM